MSDSPNAAISEFSKASSSSRRLSRVGHNPSYIFLFIVSLSDCLETETLFITLG